MIWEVTAEELVEMLEDIQDSLEPEDLEKRTGRKADIEFTQGF